MSTQPDTSHADRSYALLLDEIYAEMGRHRLSQVGLAARLGVTQPWVNRRMKGHTVMTWPELDAVARALDVTLTELSRRVDERDTQSPNGGKTGCEPRHRLLAILRGKPKEKSPVVLAHPHNHTSLAPVHYLRTGTDG